MHFKFLIFRNWKGSADSGENIWRSPYSRKLEGHQVWKDGHVRQPGNHKFFPYILYYYKVARASVVMELLDKELYFSLTVIGQLLRQLLDSLGACQI